MVVWIGCGAESSDDGTDPTVESASATSVPSSDQSQYRHGVKSARNAYPAREAYPEAESDGGVGEPVVVKSSGAAGLGPILTDAKGRTLYMFGGDTAGYSHCSGTCAKAWPPLLTQGKPMADGDVRQTKLGTLRRHEESFQVTYSGWPLYRFKGDPGPGTAAGNGIDAFGARWHALTQAGNEPDD